MCHKNMEIAIFKEFYNLYESSRESSLQGALPSGYLVGLDFFGRISEHVG